MAANSRFSVSIHLMTSLAGHAGEPVTSDYLAGSVNTNPVVIRRLISRLRKAGLVYAQPGKSGGTVLARAASQITLYDIYQAVEDGDPFVIPDKPEKKSCPVSCEMKRLLAAVFDQTKGAMAKALRRVRVSDLHQEVLKASKPAA